MGDLLIEKSSVAPEWMINISLATQQDADWHLQKVPDDEQMDIFVPILCAILLIRWRSGEVSIGAVRSLGWELHMANLLPDSKDGFANWGVILEVQSESLDEAWGSEAEIRILISSLLDRYAIMIPGIPEWVIKS